VCKETKEGCSLCTKFQEGKKKELAIYIYIYMYTLL